MKKNNSEMKSNPCHKHLHLNKTKTHLLSMKCPLSTPFQLSGHHLIFNPLPEIQFNLFTTHSTLVLLLLTY